MDYFEDSRKSLKKALVKGDFERAKEKIEDNINLISSNIKDLQDYLFKMGSQRENKNIMERTDKNIETTGRVFTETQSLLKDFVEHKFSSKSEKIENIKKIKQFEDRINRFRERFDDIVNKIKKIDTKLIDSARNSFRMSSFKPDQDALGRKGSQQMNVIFMNGKDYLYSEVEDRENTVNLITKVMSQLNDHSKEQAQMVFKQGEMVDSIEANIGETRDNMKNAVVEIKEANEINKSSGGMMNKVIFVIIIIALLLILLTWIMPK